MATLSIPTAVNPVGKQVIWNTIKAIHHTSKPKSKNTAQKISLRQRPTVLFLLLLFPAGSASLE